MSRLRIDSHLGGMSEEKNGRPQERPVLEATLQIGTTERDRYCTVPAILA